MKTLKSRLWSEYRISCKDAVWDKRGAILRFDDITDPNERAARIANKTECDVIHLSDNKLLIDRFK